MGVLAGMTLMFGGAQMARGADVGNEECLGCHGADGFADDAGRSLFIGEDAFAASVHAPLPCTACHADIKAAPHEEKPKAVGLDTCVKCHEDVVGTYRKSVHGAAQSHGASEAAICSSCHASPHVAKRRDNPGSAVYPLNLPRTCGNCHGDAEFAKRNKIPIGDAYQLYMDSIHGRALTKSGLLVAANCSSCHGFHEIQPKKNAESKVSRKHVPATCGACHAGVLEEYEKSVHGKALARGSDKAPVCVDCHTAHQIARVDTEPWKLKIVHECGTCHEESLKTYRDTFHGQVTSLGFTTVARCSDCHGSHEVLPSADPNSTVSAGRIVTTCKKCHPQANENFVQFTPHADPHDAERYPLLYFTTMSMHLLIIGVFAFFGLHTILWFVRSLFGEGDVRGPH